MTDSKKATRFTANHEEFDGSPMIGIWPNYWGKYQVVRRLKCLWEDGELLASELTKATTLNLGVDFGVVPASFQSVKIGGMFEVAEKGKNQPKRYKFATLTVAYEVTRQGTFIGAMT